MQFRWASAQSRRTVITQPGSQGIISPQGHPTASGSDPGPGAGTRCWSHVTQALCTDGSAVNNVIRELSRESARHGIRSAVAASDNRDNVFPDADLLPVDFLTYLSREYLTRREVREDVLVGHLGLRRRNVRRLFRPVAEALDATQGPIVVHDGLLGAAGLVTIKARHPRRPLFLYVHNSLSRGYSRRELRRFIDLTDAVICVSGATRDEVAARLGDHPVRRKLVVVHNGVDSTRFHPGGPTTGTVPSILFVGMMREIKGPHVLMAALQILRARDVPFSATFLGSSTHAVDLPLSAYEERLHHEQMALGPSVTFRPFVPNTEVPTIYRRHDILVVPSQFDDPCPLVLFEGMASGLAAVASRRGGIPEIGAQSIDYFDDADGLAAALEALITDPGRRERQATRSRERALELSWASTFDQVQAVVGRTEVARHGGRTPVRPPPTA
jgi:glycosyltransferase involved in cell wall biosynthesis